MENKVKMSKNMYLTISQKKSMLQLNLHQKKAKLSMNIHLLNSLRKKAMRKKTLKWFNTTIQNRQLLLPKPQLL
jgi:hypothetical protein